MRDATLILGGGGFIGKRLVAEGKSGVLVTILCDGAEKYLSEKFWDDPEY